MRQASGSWREGSPEPPALGVGSAGLPPGGVGGELVMRVSLTMKGSDFGPIRRQLWQLGCKDLRVGLKAFWLHEQH